MMQAIITDIDRQWALEQMPDWFRLGSVDDAFGEVVDDGGWLDDEPEKASDLEKPSWSMFVAEEIEKFESHYAGEFRSGREWSSIWRKGWWPKVSPRKRFPKSAPKETHPYFLKGTQEFAVALRLASEAESAMWVRFGVAQFKPDDPRVKTITDGAKSK